MNIIRKVILTMDENHKYEIIKKLVDSNGNKKTALSKSGVQIAISNLIKGYNEKGKAFFVHGNAVDNLPCCFQQIQNS